MIPSLRVAVFCPVCEHAIDVIVTLTPTTVENNKLTVECETEISPASLILHAPCIEGETGAAI